MDEPGSVTSTRTLWRMLELLHAAVYFVPERKPVYDDLGFRGGWMAYFATRSAALGEVHPAVVTACFHNFAQRMVERALPDAWQYASPEEALAARYAVFHRFAVRVLGDEIFSPTTRRLADELCSVVHRLVPHGSPMFAAHASLPEPEGDHVRLFWAATALREYRGDAHIAVLRTAGLSPVEAHALMVALRLAPPEQRQYRGWTAEEWARGVAALTERAWLDPAGDVTHEGRRHRSAIERDTDRLAGLAWSECDEAWLPEASTAMSGIVGRIVTAGAVPFPNGMGVPPAPELAPRQ